MISISNSVWRYSKKIRILVDNQLFIPLNSRVLHLVEAWTVGGNSILQKQPFNYNAFTDREEQISYEAGRVYANEAPEAAALVAAAAAMLKQYRPIDVGWAARTRAWKDTKWSKFP